MANVYVRSGAGGAGTGADWANACLTLAAGITASAAGDSIWVSEDHAETQATALTATFKGTAASPNRCICVNHAGSVPPVSADLRTTATISCTGAAVNMTINGTAYIYGITFNVGATGNNTTFITNGAATTGYLFFDACSIACLGNSSSTGIRLGGQGSPPVAYRDVLNNTTLSFALAGQGLRIQGDLIWQNTASAILGTVPTTLVTTIAAGGNIQFLGVDLSALVSKTLFTVSGAEPAHIVMQDCKLGASVTITTGSIVGQGGVTVEMINCDSANTNYRFYRQNYQATETQETTIVRSGGATDGVTAFSRKIVTTANTKLYAPYYSDWMPFWNSATGGALTIAIAVINGTGAGVTLQQLDAWIEVEGLGTASFPFGTFVNDGPADPLATGTNQSTDSTSTWTTTGLTTPVQQVLSVSFTPQVVGFFRVRMAVAKPS